METSVPLIEMDSAVIDKGTDEQLVRQLGFCYRLVIECYLIF